MNFTFRKASRTEAKPLIGLYAESGGGKTYTALLLAKGFCDDMTQVGMVETEAGRGEAWAEDPLVGGYQVLPIRGDFAPAHYGKAISAAEQAGLKALIIDSASHEWEGAGGVLSMAAENQAAGKKGPIVWQQPKMQHQREFMLRLMQTPIPLVIVCMRAKYPMYQITAAHLSAWKSAGNTGKPPTVGDWARSTELDPKQAEDILYEMFVHGWLDKETHSFHGTKYTLEELRVVIEDGKPITVETGKRLAAWAKGSAVAAPKAKAAQAASPEEVPPLAIEGGITLEQAMDLGEKFSKLDENAEKDFLKIAKLTRIDHLRAEDYAECIDWIGRRPAAMEKLRKRA